jgi:ligand-binding SRPBCC domain-containing protein
VLPRYLIVRKFDVTEDGMPEVGRRSNRVIDGQFPEIVWEHSHVVVEDDGLVTTYCVYRAPDAELVRRHAIALGQHVFEINEIAGDVTPADFPLDEQAEAVG